MDAKTLEALKGSIAKWEAIVAGTANNKGPANCPLCQLFNRPEDRPSPDRCVGCPVFDATGAQYCAGSPYEEYEGLEDLISEGEEEEDEEGYSTRLEAAAQAELDFLRSLLPL